MPSSTVTSKGQITVPKGIRDRLGIQAGDILEFVVDESGQVLVRARTPEGGVCGVLADFAPRRPVTVEQMNKAIRRRVAERSRDRDE